MQCHAISCNGNVHQPRRRYTAAFAHSQLPAGARSSGSLFVGLVVIADCEQFDYTIVIVALVVGDDVFSSFLFLIQNRYKSYKALNQLKNTSAFG